LRHRVIFLTAQVDIDSITKGFAVGVIDYITMNMPNRIISMGICARAGVKKPFDCREVFANGPFAFVPAKAVAGRCPVLASFFHGLIAIKNFLVIRLL
jgi:hypothetical protein